MEQQAMSATDMRIILFLAGLVVLALIYLFGRPQKPGQGKRTLFRKSTNGRVEPTLGIDGAVADDDGLPVIPGEQLELLGDRPAEEELIELERGNGPRSRRPSRPLVGARPDTPIELIITLLVCARDGHVFRGSDLVVAAEKAGLEFGDRGIFHRMPAGERNAGPVFSMANMLKPGSFDMARIEHLETPGVTLFMALPGPLPALDAWDTVLPTAQRLAELLDGNLLDEKRGALGRQGIAHIRDQLRAWDRQQESARPRGMR